MSKKSKHKEININELLKKENIQDVDLADELSLAMLNYAIEVIKDRSLPLINDGMKPVQRRILYTGWNKKYLYNGPFIKCAKYVGDVMGDFHPHGDASIYQALVAMAQPWTNRYPLISFHGNVGNDVGDPAAHMRYCVVEGTLVNTNYGLIPIQNLQDYVDRGLYVESINQHNRANKWFDSDMHSVFTINTEHGFELSGTYNHPILVLDNNLYKWKLLEEVKEGDIAVINCKQDQISADWDIANEEQAQFIGTFLANSSIRHLPNGGYWHCKIRTYNQYLHNFLFNYLQRLIIDLNITSKLNVKIRKLKRQFLYEITINSKILYQFLRENYDYVINNISIPSVILKSSKYIQKIFLLYLFENHAQVSIFNDAKQGKKCFILYSSKYKYFLQQIQILLLQFGIVSTVYEIPNKKKKTFKLKINQYQDLYWFYKNINFISDEKINILREIINLYNEDLITNRDFVYSKIINKKLSIKEKHVYSIKVNSECHSFTANGFINHNTEAKLNKLAEFNMDGINNKAVDFKSNYSDITQEPITLPGIFPNLLANGTQGIAVGYSTNIPSHNLNELCNAIIAYIKNNNITLDELMKIMPCPDFPSGSLLINNNEIKKLYETGQGKLTFKAKYELKNNNIIINELPPEVNREKLVEKLQQLCLIDKKIPGVSNIKDLSTIHTNIIIELSKNAIIDLTINELFNQTELIKNCSFIIRAILDNTPKVFSLKEYFNCYLQHRRECINKENKIILNRLNDKLHIQNGINIIVNSLSTAIKLIEQAETDKDAKEQLKSYFNLDDNQAEAILEFKLRRLTKLNKNDILNNIKKLTIEIADTNQLLNTPALVDQKIINQLEDLKTRFGDNRRTQLINNEVIEKVEVQDALLILTHKNNIYLISQEIYNSNFRSGVLKEKNEIYKQIIQCKTNDLFLVILENNNYIKLTFTDLLAWNSKENIIYIFILNNNNQYITCFTQNGLMLKINESGFKARNKKLAPIFSNFENSDKIIHAQRINSDKDNIITLISQKGIINRFYEQSFKESLTANKKGIPAISLKNEDIVNSVSITKYNAAYKIIIYTKQINGGFGYKMLDNTIVGIKSRINKGSSYVQFANKDPGYVHKMIIVADKYVNLDNRGRIRLIDTAQLESGTKISKPIKLNYEPAIINF